MLLRCKGNMKSLINIYSLRILSFFKPRLILSSQLEKERVQLAFVLQKHLSWLTSHGQHLRFRLLPTGPSVVRLCCIRY